MKREQQGKSQLLTIPPLSRPATLCNRPTQKQRNSFFPHLPTPISARCCKLRTEWVCFSWYVGHNICPSEFKKKGLHLPNEEAAVLVNSVGVRIMQLNTFWVWDAKSKWVEHRTFKLLHRFVRILYWLHEHFSLCSSWRCKQPTTTFGLDSRGAWASHNRRTQFQDSFVPVTNAGFSLDVLQVKLRPGVRHGFGLLNRMLPRILLSQTEQNCWLWADNECPYMQREGKSSLNKQVELIERRMLFSAAWNQQKGNWDWFWLHNTVGKLLLCS